MKEYRYIKLYFFTVLDRSVLFDAFEERDYFPIERSITVCLISIEYFVKKTVKFY